jgi:hypothetical protein
MMNTETIALVIQWQYRNNEIVEAYCMDDAEEYGMLLYWSDYEGLPTFVRIELSKIDFLNEDE